MAFLEVEGLVVKYDNYEALKDVYFSADRGDVVFVIGPNGSGKSTLLKAISLMLKPVRGMVKIDGIEITTLTRKDIAKKVAYVNFEDIRERSSKVIDFLLTARYVYQPFFGLSYSLKDLNLVDEIVRILGLNDLLDRKLDTLSTGELQKVVIARALIQESDVLLFDEPSAFLDIKHKIEVLDSIRKVTKRESKLSIIVVHDIYIIPFYADKVLMLKNGKAVVFGDVTSVLRKDILEKVYGVKILMLEVGSINIPVPYSLNY